MQLIRPSFQIMAISSFPSDYDYNDVDYIHPENQKDGNLLIEAAGRTCYKTEDKIGPGTAEKFIEMIRANGHLSVMEHSWQIKKISVFTLTAWLALWSMIFNRMIRVAISNWHVFFAGNIRQWEEWELSEKRKAKMKRLSFKDALDLQSKKLWRLFAATVRIVCDRGVTHELVRHRLASYSQESTRYCNYSKKGDGHITFIIPSWVTDDEIASLNTAPTITEQFDTPFNMWYMACRNAEIFYLSLLNQKWSPQQARSVLPNSLKTEIVVTASWDIWQHIFCMRSLGIAGKPHPQMLEIMEPLCYKFYELSPATFGPAELARVSLKIIRKQEKG